MLIKIILTLVIMSFMASSCTSISPVRGRRYVPRPIDNIAYGEVQTNYGANKVLTCDELEELMRFIMLAQSNIKTGKYDIAEKIIYDNLNILIGVKGRQEFWKGVNYELLSYLYEARKEHYSALKFALNAQKVYERSLDEDFSNSYELITEWLDHLNGKDLLTNTDVPLKTFYPIKGEEVISNRDQVNTMVGSLNRNVNQPQNVAEIMKQLEKLQAQLDAIRESLKNFNDSSRNGPK